LNCRQYLVTSDILLSRQIKHMLAKLAATATSESAPGASRSLEEQVTAEVRACLPAEDARM